jgi:hypothetical protein
MEVSDPFHASAALHEGPLNWRLRGSRTSLLCTTVQVVKLSLLRKLRKITFLFLSFFSFV